MTPEPSDRAQWIASRILPLESQIRGWLRRVTPPSLETDDVIQEAYAILWGLPDVSHIRNPRAYLYQVVKSVVSEHLRRAGPVAVGSTPDLNSPAEPEEGLTPERILSGRQQLDRLYRAIMRLPEPARTIFVMRKIDNLPQKVIAGRLRVSEHVVENHVARGLRVILLQLAKEDNAPEDERAARRKGGAADA
jgi:RNA polymerase sigma-70 factor (ECF subfamily)